MPEYSCGQVVGVRHIIPSTTARVGYKIVRTWVLCKAIVLQIQDHTVCIAKRQCNSWNPVEVPKKDVIREWTGA